MLRSLTWHGNVQVVQAESGHIEKAEYEKLYGLMNNVANHPVSGLHLKRQLEKWVERAG